MSGEIYPNLQHFFSAYFHEFRNDLLIKEGIIVEEQRGDPKNFELVVERFKRNEENTLVSATILDLEHLIDQNLNEEQLRHVVTRKLHGNVYAPGMGMTYQEWLKAVLAILKADNV